MKIIPLHERGGVKKLVVEQIQMGPLTPGPPWPLSLVGARGKKSLLLTPSPPLGARVAAGRVRGWIGIFSRLRPLLGGGFFHAAARRHLR